MMSDSEADTRPRISRAELRRLRDSMANGQSPLPAEVPAPVLAGAMRAQAPGASRGTILTVCTGNICRSPLGEALLRSSLRDLGVRVHSAGTHALVDHEMTEQAQQLAARHGAEAMDAAAHRARLLGVAELEQSDLVLAMTREHRSHSVQLAPSVLHRAFTVREFARLAASLSEDAVHHAVSAAGADPSARLRALARLVGGQRGIVPGAADEDDVIDPYRRSQATYDLSASQLVPAIGEVARVVRIAIG